MNYWRWLYNGMKGALIFFWNEIKGPVYYIIFSIIYWLIVGVIIEPLIFLTPYLLHFILIWGVLSILIGSYSVYLEDNPKKDKK